MTWTNVFGGQPQNPTQVFLNELTLAADTTLFWPWANDGSQNLLAKIMLVSASVVGVDVTLPPAEQASNGEATMFINNGANSYQVLDSTGASIATVAAGIVKFIYLIDNATESWGVFTFGTGSSAADASALAGAGLIALAGVLNEQISVTDISMTGYNLDSSSRAIFYNWTSGAGAFTTSDPATLGSGWFSGIKNSGNGAITLTPAAGTIDGGSAKTFNPGDSAFIVRDGSNLITVGFGQSVAFTFDYISINVAGTGNFTLNASQQNRISYRFTGVLTGNRSIIVPATTQQYWVDNSTTGAFTLDVGVAAQPTPVVVVQGGRSILYCNGSEVVDAVTGGISLPLAIADGGTGATTAAGARANLGSTAVGDALFTAATAAAARATLGLGALAVLNTVGTAQIDNNAVTFAKMQAITDQRLLGSQGGTAVEEIAVGSGLTLAANTLTASVPTAANIQNMIINGGMQVNQRVVTTGAADDIYINDRFYILTETSTITISQLSNPANGVPSAVRLTQAQAGSQRMGVAQIVESINCRDARGQALASNWWVTSSTSQNIKYAILEWPGTADAVTSDVVNNWSSGTYTPGNFFIGTVNVLQVGTVAVTAATPAVLPAITASAGSSMNNIIVFIWTESTCAQNVTLDLSMVQCALGATLGSFVWPQQPQVLFQCQRYYQKSFAQSIKPAQNTGAGVGWHQGVAASTASSFSFLLLVQPRTTGISATLYNPSATNAQVRNTTTNTDCTVSSGAVSDGNVLFISYTSPGGSAATNSLLVGYTIESEL